MVDGRNALILTLSLWERVRMSASLELVLVTTLI
jgi:hypothetical protein